MQSVRNTDLKLKSTYQVAITAVGGDRPGFNGTLLRIGNGQLHFQSDRWIEPGREIAARFNHIALTGAVAYCKRQDDGGYLTCVDVATESAQARREPRFPIDVPGTIIVIGDHGTSVMDGVITNISSSGLGLKMPSEAEVSSTICIETAQLLVAGEVRHCSMVPGGFSVGILLTDIFSDQARPHSRSHERFMEKARALRRLFPGHST